MFIIWGHGSQILFEYPHCSEIDTDILANENRRSKTVPFTYALFETNSIFYLVVHLTWMLYKCGFYTMTEGYSFCRDSACMGSTCQAGDRSVICICHCRATLSIHSCDHDINSHLSAYFSPTSRISFGNLNFTFVSKLFYTFSWQNRSIKNKLAFILWIDPHI